MTEYRLYKSKSKALKLLLPSVLFVSVGIFLLNQPDTSRFMSWAFIVFFGLGIPLGLFQLLDKRPQIIVNELGIFDRTVHKDFINWEIIHDAYLVRYAQERFICLVVDEQFEPSVSQNRFKQKMARAAKAIGFQELNLNVGNLSVKPERLMEFIHAMRTADRSARESLIKQALPNMA